MTKPGWLVSVRGSQLRLALAVAMLGIAISGALHVYFVISWSYYLDHYLAALPLHRQRAIPPLASLFATTLSALHGALALFIAGVACSVLVRELDASAIAVFAAAIGYTHIVLWSTSSDIGNLWPLSFVFIFLVTAVPAALGAAMGRLGRAGIQHWSGHK